MQLVFLDTFKNAEVSPNMHSFRYEANNTGWPWVSNGMNMPADPALIDSTILFNGASASSGGNARSGLKGRRRRRLSSLKSSKFDIPLLFHPYGFVLLMHVRCGAPVSGST
jgi:hypothetical protein